MSLGEFDLIERYFKPAGAARDDVVVGIGDDGAVLEPGGGDFVVSSMATSGDVARCAAGDDPELLAREVTAAAMNRLAARGVVPAWLTLGLTLPAVESPWLERFSHALLALAQAQDATLVGGDTTRGPLNVTITAHGIGDADAAIPARGDGLYVTGHLGDGLLALADRSGAIGLPPDSRPALHRRLAERTPRIATGRAMAILGAAARDTSAGLATALTALAGNGLCARIAYPRLPLAPDLATLLTAAGGWPALLRAGGDVELCLAASPEIHDRVLAACAETGVACTHIGELVDGDGILGLADPEAGDPRP